MADPVDNCALDVFARRGEPSLSLSPFSSSIEEIRSRIEALRPALESRISALLNGSLKHRQDIWLNSSAACPVPDRVISQLSQAVSEPHITLDRGNDARTREAQRLNEEQIESFCALYTGGSGTLIYGYNATHVLLALGRTIQHERPGSVIAHGDPDHKSSYAFSELTGWRQRILIPYSETGFYERYTVETLPGDSTLLLNALHHMYGTMQEDLLSVIPTPVKLVLDLSQGPSMMPAEMIRPFMRRAFAAALNTGKTFSPLSMGVLWLRDLDLAQRVLELNPELTGSLSGLSIKALASAWSFMAEAVDRAWYEYVWNLTRYALASLAGLDHISVIGCQSWQSNTSKLGIISFTAAGMSPQELGIYLDSAGLAVRADGRCTGSDRGSKKYDYVRISLLPHVTIRDLDALVDALRRCA